MTNYDVRVSSPNFNVNLQGEDAYNVDVNYEAPLRSVQYTNLIIDDFSSLFDGTKTYTIVPENEEITISYPEEEEEVSISPTKLLSFYEEGYGYEWDIQQRVIGRNIQYIKLLPTATSEEVKYLLLGIYYFF